MTFDLKYEENGKEKVMKFKTFSFVGNIVLVNILITFLFYAFFGIIIAFM